MKLHRWFVLLLAVLVLLTGVAACGPADDTGTTTTTGDSSTTVTTTGGSADTDGTTATNNDATSDGSTMTNQGVSSQTTASTAVNKTDFSSLKGATVKIHTGATPSDEEKAFAKNFETKYGCTVKWVTVSWGEFQTKLVQLVTSGDAMDIFKASDQNFVNYVAKKLIQPIDDYIDISNPYFSETFMDMFKWKNERYILYNPNTYISHYAFIYYNKTMFEDEGVTEPYEWYKQGKWTFEQFRETAKAMTKDTNNDGKSDILGFGTWWYEGLLLANGNSQVTLKQDGTIQIDLQQKSAYTAMQLIEDMQLVDHSFDYSANVSDMFLNSKMAMILERPWEAVGAYDMYNEDYFPDELGFCPIPTGPDANGTVYAPVLIHGYAIPTGADNPLGAVAWFLENAAYSEQHQNDADVLAERRRMISDEHLAIAKEYMANATPICSFSNSIGSWGTGKWEMWAGILRDNIPPATIVTQKVGLLKNEIQRTLTGSSDKIGD